MIFRGEHVLVGVVALALLPWIALRFVRGLREGRLPVYRTYFSRADAPARFQLLLLLHGLSFLLIALVAADLLLGLGLQEML